MVPTTGSRFRSPPTEPDVSLNDSSGSPVICVRAAAAWLVRLPAMNVMVMAVPAHHQGLPLARSHLADPGWWLAFPRSAKVPQLPDVVDFDLLLRAAQLTGLGQESFAQFRLRALLPLGRLVIESCLDIALEGMAPHCATRAFLPARSITTRRTLRRPCGVSIVAA